MEIGTLIVGICEAVFAAAAVVISIIALKKASKADNLQNKVNELELQIKQHEIDKINKEQNEANKSLVEARVVSFGNHKYRMKVWNSGNTKAYNVKASFIDNPQGIRIFDNKGKQPFEELEPQKNYELTLLTFANCDSKFKIKTEWKDSEGKNYSKTQMGDL